jgi:WD40-like Beta Propeller Repeat
MRSVLSRGRGVATAIRRVRAGTPSGPIESSGNGRSKSARRLTLVTLALACAVVAVLLSFAVSGASAELTHEFLPAPSEEINKGAPVSSGAALPGPIRSPYSMTVDSGHLWISSIGTSSGNPVNEFDAATGAFVSQLPQVPGITVGIGLAVGHEGGKGVVYVDAAKVEAAEKSFGRVVLFSEAGALLGTWTGAHTPAGTFTFGPHLTEYGYLAYRSEVNDVAVDNTVVGPAAGDVYVSLTIQNVVDVFKQEVAGKKEQEEYVTQLTGTCPVEGTTCTPSEVIPFGQVGKIAVDGSTGDVLVVDSNTVDVFAPEALGGFRFVRKITGPRAGESFQSLADIGVDGSSGEIYVVSSNGGVVDQFSATGVFLGSIPSSNNVSVAVDPLFPHSVYVGSGSVSVFGPNIVIPDVEVLPASNETPFGATLHGTVNPDGAGEASCEFEYGTSTAYGLTVPCPKQVPNGTVKTEVEAAVGKLSRDTTYYYRLVASNEQGGKRHTNTGACPADCGQFTTAGPGIHAQSASNVASTSATIEASIDPNKAPTSYYFQYSTGSTAACTPVSCSPMPAAPGEAIGSGKGDVEVKPRYISGLLPSTVYHYRVVAVSLINGKFEEFEGSDQTFTTQIPGGSALPDGRAWEMVSPPDKHGALIRTDLGGGVIQASAAGDAITYSTDAPTEAEPLGYTNSLQVLSLRGSGGWGSRDIAVPHDTSTGVSVGQGEEYRFFSEDLSAGVVQPFGAFMPSLSAEASEQTAYLRTDFLNGSVEEPCVPMRPGSPGSPAVAMHCYRPLVTGAPGYANVLPPGTVFGQSEGNQLCPPDLICGPHFAGAASDLSHVVLESGVALTGEGGGLFEWSGGKLASINLLPENGGPSSFGSLGHLNSNARGAISDDGSRIIWSSMGGDTFHLYMRDMVRKETVELDSVQGGTGSGEVYPLFGMASTDGSRVFFTDNQSLAAGSGKGAGEGRGDLYECEMVVVAGKLRCNLADLTPQGSGESARVEGVLGASRDGSWVYFVSPAVLAPGATPGVDNVYVHHEGATTFIAGLSPEDSPDWRENDLAKMPVRVSPDGRWLAFMSQRSLTGYDSRDAVSGKLDEEVFLYHAEAGGAGRLVCASCDPTGARPVGVEYGGGGERLVGGDRVWNTNQWLAANIPGWVSYSGGGNLYQSRYLSDSGRLFFNSSDALVPQDVNGTEDVYQYEPPGVGGCAASSITFSERSGGCVGLISSGSSPEESAFFDASARGGRDAEGHEGGGDVFFLTASKLLVQDYDTALDVYDAHECTAGSPCLVSPAAVPPACSTGDSCKPAPSPQPVVFGEPASATFSGRGNVVAGAVAPGVSSRGVTRARKLAGALRACHRKRGKRRVVCERDARRRYAGKASRKTNASRKGHR